MSLRLGRFGLQESASAVGLAALVSGTFSLNVGETFARGNVSYMATAAGALLGLGMLRLLGGAMERRGFAVAMERYIFVEADYVPIVLYLLGVLLPLVLSGMECVARMAKLLLVPGALALGLTLLLAAPAFRLSHLYPLFSPGFSAFWDQTREALLRFLPPGVALYVAGRGCQGRRTWPP